MDGETAMWMKRLVAAGAALGAAALFSRLQSTAVTVKQVSCDEEQDAGGGFY